MRCNVSSVEVSIGDRAVPLTLTGAALITIRLCTDICACADYVHDFTASITFIVYKNNGRQRTREVCNQRLGT